MYPFLGHSGGCSDHLLPYMKGRRVPIVRSTHCSRSLTHILMFHSITLPRRPRSLVDLLAPCRCRVRVLVIVAKGKVL